MRAGGPAGGDGRAVWVVRLLLLLFPRHFRRRYGNEMMETFRDHWAEQGGAGVVARVIFLVRTAVSLVVTAIREQLDGLLTYTRWHVDAAPAPTPILFDVDRRGSSMDGFSQDIRYAARVLRRSRSFTAIVLATLALGIGMNTAVFSVLYGVLYRPLPYANPAALVEVGRTHPSVANELLPLSPASFLEVKSRMRTVESLEGAVWERSGFVLTDVGEAGRYSGLRVSGGFFDMLGVRPALGDRKSVV